MKNNKEDGAEKVDEGSYKNIIGCLMYLTATRRDIMFLVSLLSGYMHVLVSYITKLQRGI